MSEARTILDRFTEALLNEDLDAAVRCYRPDAVVVAPEGTFKGLDQIAEYFRGWIDPFSDLAAEISMRLDVGNQALDEWVFSATHTGPLEMPTGDPVAATGKRISVRGVDIGTVEGGLLAEHHIYYDQVEVLGQLGLLP